MNLRNRDDLGWRIPKPGSRSAAIYELMRQGLTRSQIQERLGGTVNSLGVLMFRIRNPARHNAWSADEHRRRAQRRREQASREQPSREQEAVSEDPFQR